MQELSQITEEKKIYMNPKFVSNDRSKSTEALIIKLQEGQQYYCTGGGASYLRQRQMRLRSNVNMKPRAEAKAFARPL
jgi:hypothetical protein